LYKNVDDEVSFTEFLKQVAFDTMQDFDHQDIHFEDLIKGLPAQVNNPGSPLFNVMLVSYVGKYKADGKIQKATRYLDNVRSSRYDFTFLLVQDDEHHQVSAEYAVDAFTAETAKRLMDYVQIIFKQVVDNPDIKLGDIQLIGDDMRTKMLKQFRPKAKGLQGVLHDRNAVPRSEAMRFDFE
jgi:non-ribosomal peptide synthetase component F